MLHIQYWMQATQPRALHNIRADLVKIDHLRQAMGDAKVDM